MRRFLRVLPLPLLLAVAAAQDAADEAPGLPAGPAIAFVNAFPAQAGFDRPLFVAFAASDPAHAYVVTQPGQVFAVARDGKSEARHTFFDLGDKVFTDNWEEGLLGFAFDPAYADNGFVFACWSEKIPNRKQPMGDGREQRSNRQSVIARYATQVVEGRRVVDLASELRVLEVFQPFGNHNGGTIVFGPDGMLYVALGDGGAANDPFGNGQALSMLLGKVLRLDVRKATKETPYTIPADNPFVGKDGARGEIWCYGLRNPWRIAFDRKTGELWCGDVGQDRIEEVDQLVKGGNYGWNAFEASELFRGRKDGPLPGVAIAPIAEYPHPEGLSITGGHVYRGTAIPGLDGWFVYGDFMTMKMWACKEGKGAASDQVVQLERAPQMVASFAEEPDGELLLCGFGGRDGVVWRIVPRK
ncbi:MAG: PQQ-dependent sugar dehydrogenase [Planctomycetes bacterium]|nr:PQQ-dependent sugar dehydrogenase [Planctomycetota bacterium]